MRGTKLKEVKEKGLDLNSWHIYMRNNQKEYIRKKLRCIKIAIELDSFDEIVDQCQCSRSTLSSYFEIFLQGGLDGLVKKKQGVKGEWLNQEQKAELEQIMLESKPCEFGYGAYIWTGDLVKQLIKDKFNVIYKSGVYDLLKRMGFTHQRAHNDYANADKDQQRQFMEDVKKNS